MKRKIGCGQKQWKGTKLKGLKKENKFLMTNSKN
jgi:hypothetical protein